MLISRLQDRKYDFIFSDYEPADRKEFTGGPHVARHCTRKLSDLSQI